MSSDLSEACELACVDLVGDRVERLSCIEFLQSLKPTCVHVRCPGRVSWKRELSLALEFAVTCSDWKPKIVIEHPWFLHKKEHHLIKEFLRKQARCKWHVVDCGNGGALTNWDKVGSDNLGDYGEEPGELRWQVRKRLAKLAGRPEDQVTYFDVNEAVAESRQRHERIKELLLIGEDEFQHYHVESENGGPPNSNESSHEDGEQEDEPRRPLPGERSRTVQDLVRRAHDGLGHPHRERFLRILKEAKASDEVMKAAKDLKCSVCEKFAQTRPPRRAAPPREHGINEVLGMDTVWLPYIRGRRRMALNVIDYSSHFQMVIPMRGRSPEAAWGAYRTWVKFFGPPKQIWADQGGEFKGVFKTKAGLEGTHVEPSSLESPFQRGVAERHGKTFKTILEKAMVEYTCQNHDDWLELVDVSIMMKNRLVSRGGFSPVQRVLGYLPRIPGGLMAEGHGDLEWHEEVRFGDNGVLRAMAMRKAAAKAFFEADCCQALRNAASAGPRPQQDYAAGQMVYFYRIGHSKTGNRQPQRWYGPARIITTDPPSTMWLSYQGNLVKASPERIRPASEEESLTISGWLKGLTEAKEAFDKDPRKGYIDLSKEPLPEFDNEDIDPDDYVPDTVDADETVNHPERRVRRKTTEVPFVDTPIMLPAEAITDEKAGDPDETGDDVILADEDLEPPEAGPQTDGQWEPLRGEGDESGNERPTKRHRQELLEIYYAKLETFFKARQRKEIKLKELSKLDTQAFFNATAKEIRNNLETGAYKMLDDHTSETVRAMKPERIMESRYVRTAKPLEADEVDKAKMDGLWLEGDHGGPCKAKVRHVMKGFSEEGAEDLEAATPQVTREAVMFTAQMIASKPFTPEMTSRGSCMQNNPPREFRG